VIALHGEPRQALALGGEGILVLTAHAEALGHHLCGAAHVLVGEHAPEAVGDERVAKRHVTEAPPLPHGRHVRGAAHALHAAGHHHLGVTRADLLRGHGHRAQARPAELVDGGGGHGVGDSCGDRALPRGPLPEARLQDAAHQDVVHLVGGHARSCERLTDRDGAQIGGRNRCQGSHERADGRPDRPGDDGRAHAVRR